MTWLDRLRIERALSAKNDLVTLANAVAKRSKNELVVLSTTVILPTK